MPDKSHWDVTSEEQRRMGLLVRLASPDPPALKETLVARVCGCLKCQATRRDVKRESWLMGKSGGRITGSCEKRPQNPQPQPGMLLVITRSSMSERSPWHVAQITRPSGNSVPREQHRGKGLRKEVGNHMSAQDQEIVFSSRGPGRAM